MDQPTVRWGARRDVTWRGWRALGRNCAGPQGAVRRRGDLQARQLLRHVARGDAELTSRSQRAHWWRLEDEATKPVDGKGLGGGVPHT